MILSELGCATAEKLLRPVLEELGSGQHAYDVDVAFLSKGRIPT